MEVMKFLPLLLVGGVVLTAATPVAPSRDHAASFQKKLTYILQQAEVPAKQPRRTTLTQDEVNSYLHFDSGEQLPVGVTEPTINIEGQGRVSGRAVVDLDIVRQKQGTGGILDPLTYLRGRLPLTVAGILHTQDGKGRFELHSATAAGVPINKTLLQKIVAYYSRNEDFPNGINIDDTYDLPAAIVKIEVGEGSAVIVQ